MKMNLRVPRLDEVERIYLAVLRVGVLALASICLLAAVWFAADAVWRVFVSTDVPVEETVVAPADVAGAVRSIATAEAAPEEIPIPAHVRQTHAAFVRDVFPAYYAVYRQAAQAYGKPEDETLSQQELLVELGYGLETYADGERLTTKLFVENPDYQRQAQAAIAATLTDASTVRILQEYKDAQREQRCTTRNVRQRVSQVCGYYFRYDCSYTRTVPVRECEAVYPEGIVSPLAAFARADGAFGELWLSRSAANQEAAAVETAGRHATRSRIGPNLLLALQILGGFLVIMFFFLMVAIERHLRSFSRMQDPAGETPPAGKRRKAPEAE